MDIQKELLLWVGAALVCAMVVSFIMCPLVKSFAYKIGAIDVPKDSRRMHKKPVPRLGGLAIFLGFMVSILLFVHIDHQMRGILLGAVIIVVLGVVDDMTPLRAKFKFLVQILAALVAVYHGVVIEILTNPNVFSDAPYWSLGWMKYPVTVLWIVGVTNAVNLIDGLDGLASGVSTISAMTMLVIAILVSEQQVEHLAGALVVLAQQIGVQAQVVAVVARVQHAGEFVVEQAIELVPLLSGHKLLQAFKRGAFFDAKEHRHGDTDDNDGGPECAGIGHIRVLSRS
mgnify:CR=1 FL=1